MDITTTLVSAYTAKKLFGPTLDQLGEDFREKLYIPGRDKIIEFATAKVENLDDGYNTNLRVVRDVFWNGSFTDEAVSAEYFGGILASSRSQDGKDDEGVYYVDLIKSLSSNQLKLHYLIYQSFNKYFVSEPSKSNLDVGEESELFSERIFLSTIELLDFTGKQDIGRDLHAILAKRLIGEFHCSDSTIENNHKAPHLFVSPSPLGIQLYAIAHNRLDEWQNFAYTNFGNFDSLQTLKFRGESIDGLESCIGLESQKDNGKKVEIQIPVNHS